MKRLVLILSLIVLWPVGASWSQLSPPNEMGVAMGHLHYFVRDVEANKKFWTELGAAPIKVGAEEVMKLPDALIFLSPGEPSGGSEGSVVNHVAFRVPNTAQTMVRLTAAGIKVQLPRRPGSTMRYAFTPEGDRVELFQDGSENVPFHPDEGRNDLHRLSRKMTVPIMTHHIHLYVPEGSMAEAKAWYVNMFGSISGKRWNYEAVDLPGMNLNFLEQPDPLAPTKGRRLDHIGFEVKNLEEFCKKLEASGATLDRPYKKLPTGFATAFLTDPWGTSIELTEGLDRY